MKKYLISFCIVIFFIITLAIAVSAHSGGTDADGGHYNHSTGEYHYHHGFPAHSHSGGCPYDYNDKTGSTSGSSSDNKTYNYEIEEDETTAGDVIKKIFEVIGISALILIAGFSSCILLGLHWLLMYPIKMLVNKFGKEDSQEKILYNFSIVIAILIICIVITIISIIIFNE